MPDDDQREDPPASGPIPLSEEMRRPSSWRGWLVAFGIVLAVLVVYTLSRPPLAGSVHAQPPPTWGSLTLVAVAKAQARAAGDPHPTGAVWLEAPRFQALPVLAGTTSTSAEADFIVSLTGTFHAPRTWQLLPGSRTTGPFLTLLVRGFDGTVTGRTITATAPSLGRLGHPFALRLGFF